MEIEFLSNANKSKWDDFCIKNKTAWFRHTSAWLDYSMCCRFDSNSKNRSFMVTQNNEILAVVPLLSEYIFGDEKHNCFAMYGDYTPLFAAKDDCEVNPKSLMETIEKTIFKIAAEDNVVCGRYFIDPLIEADYIRDFYRYNLLSAGAVPSLTTVNLVDLSDEEDVILRKMRKGHKAAIKQVLKESGYHIDVFDKNNIDRSKLLRFKEIHKIDAGRQTRTDASWNCMYDWIVNGNACLVMLWLDELQDYVCGALVMMYKKAAYYASYATLDSSSLNGHGGYIIQWSIIRYLKKQGLLLYETGKNCYGIIPGGGYFN